MSDGWYGFRNCKGILERCSTWASELTRLQAERQDPESQSVQLREFEDGQRLVEGGCLRVDQHDRIETFKHSSNRGGHRNAYTAQVRRVQVARDGKLPMWLVTNDLRSSAVEIAQLYKKRWGIESLFKWIKQHLKIKHFHGRSENAVRIQLLAALIAYLLVLLYKNRYQHCGSPWQVLAELRHALFARIDTAESGSRPRRYREPYIAPGQYQLV